jgi:hypothetical protein
MKGVKRNILFVFFIPQTDTADMIHKWEKVIMAK